MTLSPAAVSPSRAPRYRTIAPMPATMLRGAAAEPEGLDVLRDVERVLRLPGDDSLALVLWLAVRRAYEWAQVPAEKRVGMRGEGATLRERLPAAQAQAPDLAKPLKVLAGLWTRPEKMGEKQVADACDQVGRWAGEWALMRTAVLFMEAAAAAEPENALRAMDAGLMCQRLGGTELMQRAELWHQRAFGLARVAKKSQRLLSIRALLAYGNWARETGDYLLARRCYKRAARRARRTGRWKYFAIAKHNLLVLVGITDGDFAEGESHAQAALRYYPRSSVRLPHLMHDYASLLLRRNLYAAAFRILEPLPSLVSQPEVRPIIYGSIAWAAAGMGRCDLFERAVESAIPLASLYGEFRADTLMHLAEGASLLGNRDRAAGYAQEALQIALERSNAASATAAQRLSARLDRSMEAGTGIPTPSPLTEQIVADITARLPSGPEPDDDAADPLSGHGGSDAEKHSHCISPAPAWPASWGRKGSLAELEVLYEVERAVGLPPSESFAVLLWRTLRRVYSWSGSQDSRASLFPNSDPVELGQLAMLRPRLPELGSALAVFHTLLNMPGQVTVHQVADACDEVGRWATAQGCQRVAVLFLEAGAAIDPEDALRAMDAGLACQRLGGSEMMVRAEIWFERAIGLARVAKQSRRLLSIRALLAYGNWARETGDYLLARRCYERAARRAWRFERWNYFATAKHNLLVLVGTMGGEFAEGEAHAQAALDHYPLSDTRVASLAHDYAGLLLRQGLYAAAYRILEPLPGLVQQPEVRPIIHASLAWAAAGIGRKVAFEEAVMSVLPLLSQYGEFAADVRLYLAEGSFLLGNVPEAAAFATTARELAIEKQDEAITGRAEAILARIESIEPTPHPGGVPAHTASSVLLRMLRGRLAQLPAKPL